MTEETKKQESTDKAGIWGDDKLDRKRVADFLTKVMLSYNKNSWEHGTVFNLNAKWGSGKTYFLDNLYQQLSKDGFPVISFDAWEHDFQKDALATLFVDIVKQCELFLGEKDSKAKKQAIDSFKRSATRILKALAVDIAALVKLGNTANEILNREDKEELNFDVCKSIVNEKRSLKEEMRNSLINLLNLFDGKPLFILVDELDRCRPTFALEVLETIKHLFDIPDIIFLVATDTEQLCCSIKAIYGNEFDSVTYLQRFFRQTFLFPQVSSEKFTWALFTNLNFSKSELERICIYPFENGDIESMATTLEHFKEIFNISLRDIEHILHRFKAIVVNSNERKINFYYIIYLIIVRLKKQTEFSYLLSGEWNHQEMFEEIIKQYKIKPNNPLIIDFKIPDDLCGYQHKFTNIHLLRVLKITQSSIATSGLVLQSKINELVEESFMSVTISDNKAFQLCYLRSINEFPESISNLLEVVEFTNSIIA